MLFWNFKFVSFNTFYRNNPSNSVMLGSGRAGPGRARPVHHGNGFYTWKKIFCVLWTMCLKSILAIYALLRVTICDRNRRLSTASDQNFSKKNIVFPVPTLDSSEVMSYVIFYFFVPIGCWVQNLCIRCIY